MQLENTLAMVRENLNPNVGVEGIVATMFDGRTLHSREAIEILEENFGDLVFRTRIRKTVRYAEAPVKGSSVLKYDPTGAAAEAYRELAREIVAAKEAAGWRASAQACVRARSRSCSARPRRHSGRRARSRRGPPPGGRARADTAHGGQRSRRSSRWSPPTPVTPRAEPVELDATVEHVYDFEVGRSERREAPVAPASEPPSVAELHAPEPVTEIAPNVVELVPERPQPAPARAPRVEAAREAPVEPYTPPASRSSPRCPRARRGCTSRATSRPTSP